MGTLRTGPGANRPGYTAGTFISRLFRGDIIAATWPRGRRRKPTLYELSIRQRFIQIVQRVSRLIPRETNPTRDALKEWNRQNEGLRGTATIRPEDLDHARLSGRLWLPILPGGRYSPHIDVLRDVSNLLDWLEPKPGSMMVRTKEGWRTTDNCQPGAIFMVTPDGVLPHACKTAQIWPPSEAAQ